jgi:hypothetical protein
MKRALVLATLLLAVSALAWGYELTRDLRPGLYFGIEQVGTTLAPQSVVGVDLVTGVGSSGWKIDVDARLTDPDLLKLVDNWLLDLDIGGTWGQVATINQTGSLAYGCLFGFGQTLELNPIQFPNSVGLVSWTTTLEAEGYVGPFTAWLGCNFTWFGVNLALEPFAGFLVHW